MQTSGEAFADPGSLHPLLTEEGTTSSDHFLFDTLPSLNGDSLIDDSAAELRMFERDFDPTGIRLVGPSFFPENRVEVDR